LHFRTEFDENLLRFLAGNPDHFGGPFAETILAAVEFDMLTRPYVHRNTLLSSTGHLRQLKVLEKRQRGWLIECPYDIPREAALLREGKRTSPLMEPTVIAIDHERGQMHRMVRRTQKNTRTNACRSSSRWAITTRPGGTAPAGRSPSRLPRVSAQLERRMSGG